MTPAPDLMSLISDLKAQGAPFALATVVRTVSVTAAKAGAKAVIRTDGSISGGWIGGGCARGAVLSAAREAIRDGTPRLVSVQPQDLLDAGGVAAGEERDGIRFARNMCPSQGTMDIFVEPVLPQPELVICGASPVATALADLAPRLGLSGVICAAAEDQPLFATASRRIDGFAIDLDPARERYTVVATQGKGDEAALRAALSTGARYVGFVGSRRKIAALRTRLAADGVPAHDLDRVHAPAGLDLGAITPEEIALSILAQILQLRRQGQRTAPDKT